MNPLQEIAQEIRKVLGKARCCDACDQELFDVISQIKKQAVEEYIEKELKKKEVSQY